jgi:hypothetical protein
MWILELSISAYHKKLFLNDHKPQVENNIFTPHITDKELKGTMPEDLQAERKNTIQKRDANSLIQYFTKKVNG